MKLSASQSQLDTQDEQWQTWRVDMESHTTGIDAAATSVKTAFLSLVFRRIAMRIQLGGVHGTRAMQDAWMMWRLVVLGDGKTDTSKRLEEMSEHSKAIEAKVRLGVNILQIRMEQPYRRKVGNGQNGKGRGVEECVCVIRMSSMLNSECLTRCCVSSFHIHSFPFRQSLIAMEC